MEECRKERRFSLKLPCLIYASDDLNGNVQCQTVTSNVGIGGALIETDMLLPIGKKVFVELLIQRDNLFGAKHNSCIQLGGHVVRTNGCTMALAFDDDYQIVRVPKVLDFQKLRMTRIAKMKSPCEETA